MREITDPKRFEIERYRLTSGPMGTTAKDGNNGAFLIPLNRLTKNGTKKTVQVIISDGMGWDHVSVSMKERCPTWEEMCWIKDLFFRPNEVVVQFHPPEDKYINHHKYCLHLWRKQEMETPMPPLECV